MKISNEGSKNNSLRSRQPKRTAFTLVEMLVSMAILGLIVLLMGRIFADASSAYKQGLKSSDQNLNGRVVLDYIARELRQAIIDENLVMKLQSSDSDPYGMGEDLNDRISFAAIGGQTREVELIQYYVAEDSKPIGGVDVVNYKLMRRVVSNEGDINEAYVNSAWTDKSVPGAQMARNVSGFAIKLYADENDDGEVRCVRNIGDDYSTDDLPAYADIYLGLMGDSDLVEAHLKGNEDNFIHDREMIFMKRVYFRNKMGYNSDYGRELYKHAN